jgi:hypothetical protein
VISCADVTVIMVNSVLVRQTPFHSARLRVGTICGKIREVPIFYNSNIVPAKRALKNILTYVTLKTVNSTPLLLSIRPASTTAQNADDNSKQRVHLCVLCA